MKGFLTTHRGAEIVASEEIQEKIGQKSEKYDGIVVFDAKNENEIAQLTFTAQSASNVSLLLVQTTVSEQLDQSAKHIIDQLPDLDSYLTGAKSVKVHCTREGSHQYRSVDIAAAVGKHIINTYKKTLDYKQPDRVFYLYIYENHAFFGLDFAHHDLSKRHYKLFNHTEALNAITAFSLVKTAQFTSDQILIDPFMGCGMIPCEAAIYATQRSVHEVWKDQIICSSYPFVTYKHPKQQEVNFQIYGSDSQQRYVQKAKKNVALLQLAVQLKKAGVEWLDTFYERASVDCIVTDPVRPGKYRNLSELEKTYQELFYQAQYVLKPTGRLVLLAKFEDQFNVVAQRNNFKLQICTPYFQGKEAFFIMVYTK